MADAHRDLLLPPEWHIGAEFRLTAGVRRRHDGTLRANTHGFVHRIYDGPPYGSHRLLLRRNQVRFDATAVHRITGIFSNEEWTAVQFCPYPDRPWTQVWTNVWHWDYWWAELVNPLDRFN